MNRKLRTNALNRNLSLLFFGHVSPKIGAMKAWYCFISRNAFHEDFTTYVVRRDLRQAPVASFETIVKGPSLVSRSNTKCSISTYQCFNDYCIPIEVI